MKMQINEQGRHVTGDKDVLAKVGEEEEIDAVEAVDKVVTADELAVAYDHAQRQGAGAAKHYVALKKAFLTQK